MRNSRTPTLVILFLLGVIGVIAYNYWSATQRHMRIKEALFMSEDKINELIEKKAYAEKQIGMTAERVQKLEKDIEIMKQAAEQKDKEVDQMSERMKKNQQDRDKFALENSELKESLRKAQTDSILAQQDLAAKTIEFTNLAERYKKELETAKKDTSNCASLVDVKMQEFKNSLDILISNRFSKFESERIKEIIESAAKNSAAQTNANNNPMLSNNEPQQLKLLNAQQISVLNSLNQQQVQPQQADLNKQLQAPVAAAVVIGQVGQANNEAGARGKRETFERDEETTTSTSDLCILPKAEGNCSQSLERYYFDPESQRCLVFIYSGCSGNANNFETIDMCKARCLHQEVDVHETEMALTAINKTDV